MYKVKFLFFLIIFVFSVSCKDTSKTNDTQNGTTDTIQQEETSVQIPMHGTGENSSSSSSRRFEMDKETQEMIQKQKQEK